MRFLVKSLLALLLLLIGFGVAGVVALGGAYLYLAPNLPAVESLRDVHLQVPLRIYTKTGRLMAEYGEYRRIPVVYEEIPEQVIHAFLAAEDDRFFSHPGIDYQGILRAGWFYLLTGEKRQGGSTITMQVARNFFLTREKTLARKLNEIFLALKIEAALTKEEIMELYLNKIFLGQRAYGIAAAAQIYYGKELKDLSLAQAAMLAGLPKAPSKANPISNPEAAQERRDYILRRMHALGYIDDESYRSAVATSDDAVVRMTRIEFSAPYVAEMARAMMVERFGDAAYTRGLHVYTCIEDWLQNAAQSALRTALLEYDRRHGYRGPERHVESTGDADSATWQTALARSREIGGLLPGLVVALGAQSADVYLQDGRTIVLDWEAMSWARPYIDDTQQGRSPRKAADILRVGDVIRVESLPEDRWRLAEIPQVQGALVAVAPRDGGIRALVGGFDFAESKFNRAFQARRQAGSSFKPFIYTAALARGFTPSTVINDAPIVFRDASIESEWRPENYSGKFYGPTRLREALVRSRNLVSIRLLRRIGIDYTRNYLANIGFPKEDLPRNLTLALGTASVTPLQLATGFAALANGGFRVESWLIERIDDVHGRVLFTANPKVACPECELATADGAIPDDATQADSGAAAPADPSKMNLAPRVIEARDAYVMYTMMQDVIRRGTGQGARVLGREDLAGKTGTTNDQMDAWFSGFNREMTAIAWVGFDQLRPLGERETGAKAALPMWVAFMKEALRDMPESPLPEPPGLTHVRIDPSSGSPAYGKGSRAVVELYRAESPPVESAWGGGDSRSGGSPVESLEAPLF